MTQPFQRVNATANCFLLPGTAGYVLVDTGPPPARLRLVRQLEEAGCGQGDLRLVVVTHGDVDHIGSCAYLQRDFGAKIAMHQAEAKAVATIGWALLALAALLPWLLVVPLVVCVGGLGIGLLYRAWRLRSPGA